METIDVPKSYRHKGGMIIFTLYLPGLAVCNFFRIFTYLLLLRYFSKVFNTYQFKSYRNFALDYQSLILFKSRFRSLLFSVYTSGYTLSLIGIRFIFLPEWSRRLAQLASPFVSLKNVFFISFVCGFWCIDD